MCRSEESVSLADIDQWLYGANVPEWAARHVADNHWKWSDVGMPPARQTQPATQVLATQPAASQEAHAQQQQPVVNISKKAKWRSPSSRSPSPPYARHAPHGSSLQAVSPAVVRACGTLPGFFPDAGASEASTVLHTQASMLVPPKRPLQQTQQQPTAAAVHQSSSIPAAEQAEQDGGTAVTHSRAMRNGTALAQEHLDFGCGLHLEHAGPARVAQPRASTACTSDDPLHSWISQVAVPKVRLPLIMPQVPAAVCCLSIVVVFVPMNMGSAVWSAAVFGISSVADSGLSCLHDCRPEPQLTTHCVALEHCLHQALQGC